MAIKKQLLHLVFGGELEKLGVMNFRVWMRSTSSALSQMLPHTRLGSQKRK